MSISKMKDQKYVILYFADLFGSFRGRALPVKEIDDVLAKGTGIDGGSVPGFVGITESDVVLKPDPKTFTVFPNYFYDRDVGGFFCDVYRPGGKRLESDPRYICQKSVEKIRNLGYEPIAGAEPEFYLVKQDDAGAAYPIEGEPFSQRYLDLTPDKDLTEKYRMDFSDALSQVGLDVQRHGHEVGSSQQEITYGCADPVKTSENSLMYKFVAKMLANRKYGWIATFMPKPWFGRVSSGMHAHMSLVSKNSKRNAFFDPKGFAGISQLGRYFIGGLLEHARALAVIVAPTVNSYKRLVPHLEAPVYAAWSKGNRSDLVRIPEYFVGLNLEKEARAEFRCPDALSNPYLDYAVLFEAGLDGIKKKIDPGDPMEDNVYELSEAKRKELHIGTLPGSLKEALEEWNNDDICVKALGKETAEKFREAKNKEWKEYEPHMPKIVHDVTAWEVKKYLFG